MCKKYCSPWFWKKATYSCFPKNILCFRFCIHFTKKHFSVFVSVSLQFFLSFSFPYSTENWNFLGYFSGFVSRLVFLTKYVFAFYPFPKIRVSVVGVSWKTKTRASVPFFSKPCCKLYRYILMRTFFDIQKDQEVQLLCYNLIDAKPLWSSKKLNKIKKKIIQKRMYFCHIFWGLLNNFFYF